MKSLKLPSRSRLLNILLLLNIGLLGQSTIVSAETHADYCKRVWKMLAEKADWDKKHPGPPYRSYQERHADGQSASACAVESVRQANRQPEGDESSEPAAASEPARAKTSTPPAKAMPAKPAVSSSSAH